MLRLLLCALTGQCLAAGPSEARPNVLLILADDFGYEWVGANGGLSCPTPRLDALAASGMRFERCHVQPLCTPTRLELMTGRSNVRNYRNFGLLPRDEITFGKVFAQAGYHTGICGKWQLGREPDSPQHFGFAQACLWQHTRRPPRYANPGLEYDAKERDFTQGEYGPDLLQHFALDFITSHKGRPWLLYYPMLLTHDPFHPTPDSANWDPKRRGEKGSEPANYPDMVAYLDKQVGQLTDHLQAQGELENTLLMFLGDNGSGRGLCAQTKEGPRFGGKGSTKAQGTHVPLLVHWPAGLAKAGATCRDLISATDIFPTLCEAAAIAAPTALDGVSFLPQLRGQVGHPRPWLYHWYSPRQGSDKTLIQWAMDETHKLYDDGRLYDLRDDPLEQHPLKAEGVAAEKLKAVLLQFAKARPPGLD
jgi:arylsulfatase A